MAPLHLHTATMKSGRRKEIITTEGVGEGGREVEEEGGVASMEAAGAVATATTMVMAAGAGTMKSRMNTMTSLKNMARPQAVVSCLIILHVHVVFARLTLVIACVLLVSQGGRGRRGVAPWRGRGGRSRGGYY